MSTQRPNRPPSRAAARKGSQSKSNKLKKQVSRYATLALVSLIGFAVIAGLVVSSIPRGNRGPAPTDGPGTFLANMGRTHVPQSQTVSASLYNSVPPTSGNHWPVWAKCGAYESPLANELQVHNLEHGYVIVQYDPDLLDEAGRAQLKGIVEDLSGWPDFYLFAPYPGIGSPIALTAWQHIQKLDTVDEAAIKAFADAYRARGPENIETGGRIAGCDGNATNVMNAPG